jgi:raffinose/stachyose/melibiose transport system substrate-binding protein
MEAAITALQGAGLTPFGIGGKDTWPAGLVMLSMVAGLYPSDEAKQGLMDGLWDGSVDLSTGTALTVMERTEAIFKAAQSNFAGAGYDEMPAAFAAGDFAMLPDGTWNAPTILEAVGDAFEVGYFPMPASDNAADNNKLDGKVEIALAVNAGSPNQEAALAWLDFFSQSANYTEFVATSGFTSAQPGIQQSDFLNSISDYTANFATLWEVIWTPNPAAGQDASYPFNYPGIAPLGSMSAAEAAKAAQDAWAAGL